MSDNLVINITTEAGDWPVEIDGQPPELIAEETVLSVFSDVSLPPAIKDRELEVSVILSDNVSIQRLNRDYRGKDKPTNVLSFGMEMEETLMAVTPPDMPVMLGDIVLAFETIRKEAEDQGKSFLAHFTHMVVHGTLHLLGYDHENDQDAEEMEMLEMRILSHAGIKNPYKIQENMS